MANFINLTCPSCGGKLHITNDIDRFSCGYCGNEHIVQRHGGVITLAPVVEGLKGVKTGVDKTASELAIKRLDEEIADLLSQRAEVSRRSTFVILISALGGFLLLTAFCSAILTGYDKSTSCMLIPGVILLLVGIVLFYRQSAKIRGRVAPIDLEIAERKKELEKHRAIVRE